MWFEFLLAMAGNVSEFFWILAIATGVGAVGFGLICVGVSMDGPLSETQKSDLAVMWKVWWRTFILLCIALPLGSIPKIDDLWKVRVGLIKFQLASPENIKAGSETIERIAHKLECQYIGCDEKKEPAKK